MQKKIIGTILVVMLLIGILSTNVKALVINKVFNDEFWEWHTRTTTNDRAYNGKHIKIDPNVITFFGYDIISYKDFLYKEYDGDTKKTFKIRVNENEANYHTLEGAGFIFNSKIDNDKLSGYIMLYTEKQLCLYRLDNIDVNTFKTAENKKVSDYGTLIKAIDKQNATIHNVELELTPEYVIIKDNESSNKINLDKSKHVGNDFGLISSYVQHDCEILSKIKFEELVITIEKYTDITLTVNEEQEKLSGAKYEIYDETGKVVCTGVSNIKGIYTERDISKGEYTVKQIVAPSGYELNTEVKKFKIDEDGNLLDYNLEEEIENLVFVNKKIKKENEDNKDKEENKKDSNTLGNYTKLDSIVINNSKPSNSDNNGIKEQTVATTRLPQTGEKVWIVGIFFAIVILGICFSKYKKYKGL